MTATTIIWAAIIITVVNVGTGIFFWRTRKLLKKCSTRYGALLLPLATIEATPMFFCVLSGVLRAGGFRIIVLADTDAKSPAMTAAHHEVSFHEVREPPDMVRGSASAMQLWKVAEARELGRMHSPVIWADVDFSEWREAVVTDPNIVTLNWTSALAKIRGGVGLTNPGVA